MYKSEILKAGVSDFIADSNDGVLASMMASKQWIDFAAQNNEWASEIIAAVFDKLQIEN
jgi:hypothetical protein